MPCAARALPGGARLYQLARADGLARGRPTQSARSLLANLSPHLLLDVRPMKILIAAEFGETLGHVAMNERLYIRDVVGRMRLLGSCTALHVIVS